jgi:hypothetical protein
VLKLKKNSGATGLMKLEFSPQILEKSPNIKFHENPSRGRHVVSFEYTDGYD